MSRRALNDLRREATYWERQAYEARKTLVKQTFTVEEGEDGLMVAVDTPCQRVMWEET